MGINTLHISKFIEKPWFGNLLSVLLLPFVQSSPSFSGNFLKIIKMLVLVF